MKVLSDAKDSSRSIFSVAVVVAALGYFVDIYDLVLFSIIRVPSLKAIGVTGAAVTDQGIFLLNVQMVGMLIGGVMWGVLGDKKGRLSVLFGSILLYSLANIANGFVQTIDQYAALRLIAGIGLAGELGAGITLVTEILPKAKRGYGTTLITSIGVSGALLAWLVAKSFGWQLCFFIGGGLGLILLLLRIGILESGMYQRVANANVKRGQFFTLFTNKAKFAKYIRCILIGLPTWYMVGILMTLSPEISKALHVTGEITGGNAIFWFYLGLTFGDMAGGLISQRLRSRRKVVVMFLIACAVLVGVYFVQRGSSPEVFYAICTIMGISSGYWVLFVTIGAEQFGTNLRSTVATTVPNFVRGALVLISLLFQWLRSVIAGGYGAENGIIYSGAIVGAICLGIALISILGLPETFGKDLDYAEN